MPIDLTMTKDLLLVDDDRDELRFFLDALDELNDDTHRCCYVCDSEIALKLLRIFDPDYVFVDFNMPRINGLDFLSLLKKDSRLKPVRVFLYSTSVTKEMCVRAMQLGAAGCIEKGSIRMLAAELELIFASSSQNYFLLKENK
jgi:CheY-like chemotaxis protein